MQMATFLRMTIKAVPRRTSARNKYGSVLLMTTRGYHNIGSLKNKVIAGFVSQVHKNPDNIAMLHGDTDSKFTYRELYDSALRSGMVLKEQYNVQPGTTIGCLSSWTPSVVPLYIATQLLNCTFVTFPHMLPKELIVTAFAQTKPNLILCEPNMSSMIDSNADLNAQIIGLDSFSSQTINQTTTEDMERLLLDDLNAGFDGLRSNYLNASSGTSSAPCLISHKYGLSNTIYDPSIYQWFFQKAAGTAPGQRVLYPAAQMGFMTVVSSMTMFISGNTLVWVNGSMLDVDNMYKTIEEQKINVIAVPPVLIEATLKRYQQDNQIPHDLSSMTSLWLGSEQVRPALFAQFVDLLSRSKCHSELAIFDLYGMNETVMFASSTPLKIKDFTEERFADCPYVQIHDNYEYRIEPDIDPAEGELQIKVKDAVYCKAYDDLYPGNVEKSLAKYTEDGWFKTGDRVEVREDGRFKHLCRVVDALTYEHGLIINPTFIEDIFVSHPVVAKCGVVQIEANEEKMTIAFIVLTEQQSEQKSSVIAELLRFYEEELDEQQQVVVPPVTVHILEPSEFPFHWKTPRQMLRVNALELYQK